METGKGNEKGGKEATTQLENRLSQVTLVGVIAPANFSSMFAYLALSPVASEKSYHPLTPRCLIVFVQSTDIHNWEREIKNVRPQFVFNSLLF